MNKLNFLLLLIMFIGMKIFPQGNIQPKEKVMNFFTAVENYSKGFNRDNKEGLFKSKQYTNQEVYDLAQKYYQAKAEDPIGFHFYLENKMKEFEEKFKNKTVKQSELMTPEKVGVIFKIISSKYGRSFTEIIGIPWFLKVQVLDIKQGKFNSSVGILGKTYLVAKVEEVIKGQNIFKEGDTIEINYLSTWLSDANKQFEKKKTYFTGLREWNCYNGNCTEIALYVFPDEDDGIYPIENEHVTAPGNYFGIKDNIQWPEFKSEFVKKYVLSEVAK